MDMSNLITTRRRQKRKYTSLGAQIESMSVGEPMSGCWLWTGSLNRKGYGQLTHQQKHMEAHRASFTAFCGDPSGKLVCHNCDQPSCVNPSHLYAGTSVDNRKDMLVRKRWSHPYAKRIACAAGHEYEVYGVSIATDGTRTCKECQRINKRNQRRKL